MSRQGLPPQLPSKERINNAVVRGTDHRNGCRLAVRRTYIGATMMHPSFEDLSHNSSPRSELRESPEFDPDYRKNKPSIAAYLFLAAVLIFIWWMTS